MAATTDAASRLLSAARALAPRIAAAADEVERERRLTEPLLGELRAAGLFRIWLPEEIGGDALDPASAMRVIEELARVDGSVAWAVMVAAQGALAVPGVSRDVAVERFNHDDIFAGTITRLPAVAVEGGYRVTGRARFASGCTYATWISGLVGVLDEEQQRSLANGSQETRQLFVPAAECAIADTWYTTGLRGTGSHDYDLDDVFVADELAPLFSLDRSRYWGGPLYRGPFIWTMRGAFAVGIARHALDVLEGMAAGKTQWGVRSPLAEQPRVQAAVARAEAGLASVRAFLYETATEVMDVVYRGDAISTELGQRVQLASAYAAEVCADIVSDMFRLGGGAAIYSSSPLDRCFRDINTLMADQSVAPRIFESAGKAYLEAAASNVGSAIPAR